MIVEHAVVIGADFRMRVTATERGGKNFLSIFQRYEFAEMAVAVNDVRFEQVYFPILGHVAMNHLNEFILQRVHSFLEQQSRRKPSLKRGTPETDHRETFAFTGPGFAKP